MNCQLTLQGVGQLSTRRLLPGADYHANECRGVIVLEKTETRNIRPRVLFTLYFIINSFRCEGVREEKKKELGTGKILVEGTKARKLKEQDEVVWLVVPAVTYCGN